jgi:hypothetical protein
VDLSLVSGTALPTGAVGLAGHGAQPYLQMPLVVGIGRWLGLERQADRVLSSVVFGLNHNCPNYIAPNYIVGVGYSFRLDGLLKSIKKL